MILSEGNDFMSAYSESYIGEIIDTQSEIFLQIREQLPGVDEKWFIEAWMKSKIRSRLDKAYPKWANMMPEELIYRFITEECGGEYKRGESWGGFLPSWVGIMYAYYQWSYNIPSKEVIKELPLDLMERAFVPFHQASEQTALIKLREIAIKE